MLFLKIVLRTVSLLKFLHCKFLQIISLVILTCTWDGISTRSRTVSFKSRKLPVSSSTTHRPQHLERGYLTSACNHYNKVSSFFWQPTRNLSFLSFGRNIIFARLYLPESGECEETSRIPIQNHPFVWRAGNVGMSYDSRREVLTLRRCAHARRGPRAVGSRA